MTPHLRNLCSSLLVLFLVVGSISAQQRALLYNKSSSTTMQNLVQNIRNPRRAQISLDQLPLASRYFVRIAPRAHILTKRNKLNATAILAGPSKPFVFLTTPESVFGRSLLEIYEDIGYEAEGIIRDQRNQDMVAIVFRYPDRIAVSNVHDGNLENDWTSRIYQTTWDNILALFTRLVQDDQSDLCKPADGPATRICLPNWQAQFVLSFPAEEKQRVKGTNYRVLQGAAGARWDYRRLLEDKLSVFEHFRGDGRTENETLEQRDNPDTPPAALIEVVGPNMNLNLLPEVVVIHLGRLRIEDCYSSGSTNWRRCANQ